MINQNVSCRVVKERKREREKNGFLFLPFHLIKSKRRRRKSRGTLFSGVLVNYRVRRFGSFHPSKMKRGEKQRDASFKHFFFFQDADALTLCAQCDLIKGPASVLCVCPTL
jgi:hypothetical protein